MNKTKQKWGMEIASPVAVTHCQNDISTSRKLLFWKEITWQTRAEFYRKQCSTLVWTTLPMEYVSVDKHDFTRTLCLMSHETADPSCLRGFVYFFQLFCFSDNWQFFVTFLTLNFGPNSSLHFFYKNFEQLTILQLLFVLNTLNIFFINTWDTPQKKLSECFMSTTVSSITILIIMALRARVKPFQFTSTCVLPRRTTSCSMHTHTGP